MVKGSKSRVFNLMAPIGDVVWMDILKDFLTAYAKELQDKPHEIILPKASDNLYNIVRGGCVTEEHKDMFVLFYHVIRATVVDWESIPDVNAQKTFINHALIDAIRFEDRYDILSMPLVWNLHEEFLGCLKGHLEGTPHANK
jgi:hypothetical protein